MKLQAFTLKPWKVELRTGAIEIDPASVSCSKMARLGARILRFAQLTMTIEPFVTLALCVMVICLSTVQALAQTPGGNIFGSDQQVGNAIREAIKWGRNLLFLMGVVFVGWGVVNYGSEKPAAKQIIASIGCFAFGGIVALVYSISQGNAVNLDTGFGN